MILPILIFALNSQYLKPPAFIERVQTISVVGDSITQFGDTGNGYVNLIRTGLAELYGPDSYRVLNAGISGNRSNDMLARFQKDVVAMKPGLITLSVGVNDVWHGFFDDPTGNGPRGIPLPDYIKNVTEMVKDGEAIGAKVVILAPTGITEDPKDPKNVKLQFYVDAERKIAKQYHCRFVDLRKAFADRLVYLKAKYPGQKLYLTIDGVHMNDDGNRLMASETLKALGVPIKRLKSLTPARP